VRHSIAYLEAHGAELKTSDTDVTNADRQAIVLAALAMRGEQSPVNPWSAGDGFMPNLPATVQFSLQWRAHTRLVEVASGPRGAATITVDSHSVAVEHVARSSGFVVASLDGMRVRARVFVYEGHVHVWLNGQHFDLVCEDPRSREFAASASQGDLTTPLPGVVAAVAVVAGQAVAAGDVLMVIEAMKMEHTIAAPYAGVVQAVHFARGDRVPEGSTLLELAPAGSAEASSAPAG
jgi:3-methylcrotonyl-CoA carboxylase alpha subunit